MYITHAELLKKRSNAEDVESPAAFNDTTDSNFFSAQLNLTAENYKKTSPSTADNSFNLGVPESSFRRVRRGIDDRLRNKSTKESNALPQTLALANFEVVSRVKVLGMLVKGIDKVSNLG
ncbi:MULTISPECIES: hypothetical protein [Pseudomonas]|uniref:hypothetical protein n=1 Tax=Pseudomonas TaxID=286 RepID=UPI000CFC8192|nr:MULTISPECIES: hypothetical protein [Pseudomonas]PQZ86622.1 hypothetical protein CQ048_21660 [Pseudomonas trivialis]PRB23026.1 hypothetical protein CQ041_21490 [Pseudomonas sp. MYb60]